MHTNFAVLTVALAEVASAFDCSGPYFSFYNRGGNALSYQRLDPALFPGTESPHLHSFDGGNALTATMEFGTTQESTCTTARIKPDNSLYWRPTLYWNGNNTGFYRVPDKFLKVYYKFGDSGNERANVTEFPDGFRMIAGNPFKRSDNSDNPGGIKWACLGDNYSRIDSTGFPKGFTSCKEGLTSELTFPACWNGHELDPKNPSAHMAWPTAGGKGLDACPASFKVARFPSIFIEFWYDVSSFDGHYGADDTPWVLSSGDPTGYGFHADFLNGWEKGVLAKATAETGYCNCGCGCGNDQMKQCFGAGNVNDDDAEFKACSAKPFNGGEDTALVDKLPGCNPIQPGPADATAVTGAGCAATAVSKDTTSSIISSSVASVISKANVASSDTSSSLLLSGFTTSEFPTISISIPNKQQAEGTSGDGLAPATDKDLSLSPETTSNTAKPSASSDDLPSLYFTTTTKVPRASAPAGEDCKAPVYVTITPTVYVTVGTATNTTCTPTIYETNTNTATVTVSAGGYKHKGHADVHHKC